MSEAATAGRAVAPLSPMPLGLTAAQQQVVYSPGGPLLVDPDGAWCRPEGAGFIAGIAPPEQDDPACEPEAGTEHRPGRPRDPVGEGPSPIRWLRRGGTRVRTARGVANPAATPDPPPHSVHRRPEACAERGGVCGRDALGARDAQWATQGAA